LPDIVAVGKLMGNGHLGDRGIVAPEVIEAFAKRIRHFNTFGGNPASCAVAHAVVKVIKAGRRADQRDGK
jgi:acetylornithine/succinyldiaminopimelate/putrescine aminotransferase